MKGLRFPATCGSLAFALLLAACTRAGSSQHSSQPQALSVDSATTGTATATSPAHPAQNGKPGFTALVTEIEAECKDAAKGIGCAAGNFDAGDFYDVDFPPGCGDDGFFGGVVADGTVLLKTLPVTGTDGAVNARLSNEQFVCIRAIARTGQQPQYYYASAIAPEAVPACEGKDICQQYGKRPAAFQSQAAGGNCVVDPEGTPSAGCATGWIRADGIDAFSNGL